MSAPTTLRTSSQDSTDSLRKRVCKACDRCRLKKSKCDGSSPCSRCVADNSICVFGERKKSHDKVYPKGYVEMLEQQQGQLIAGLLDMYRRLLEADLWPGPELQEPNGHPLTHDILTTLDIINTRADGSVEKFEEDTESLQKHLLSQGATYTTRRGSISSESEHGQSHGHARSKSHPELTMSPAPTRSLFKDNFGFVSKASQSPPTRSPVAVAPQTRSLMRPSPLHNQSPAQDTVSSIEDNDALMAWNQFSNQPDFGTSAAQNQQYLASHFNLQAPPRMQFVRSSFDDWQGPDQSTRYYDTPMSQYPGRPPSDMEIAEWQEPHNLDLDFGTFIHVTT